MRYHGDSSAFGAVSSYTFDDVQSDHSISAYFLTGSSNEKKLTVIGSFASASGAGSYLPGTKVTVDAGFVPGFAFAGWVASDGIVYPFPTMPYVMPGYDIILYANWVQSAMPDTLSPVTTTNLKGQQLTGWSDITEKLATFSINDLNQPGSPVMKVTAGGYNCYIDPSPIAMLNTRQGIALMYLTGRMQVLHSTVIWIIHKGQTAYVYLINESGTETMYLPAIVGAEKKITIPVSAKVNLNIKY